MARFLPKPKWTVYPPIEVDVLPIGLAVRPVDLAYGTGVHASAEQITLGGLQYWQTVPSGMVYLGIERAPQERLDRQVQLIDRYFRSKHNGQQE